MVKPRQQARTATPAAGAVLHTAAGCKTPGKASGAAKRLRLELPLPPPEFSLNARAHWTVKDRVNKAAQDDVLAALLASGQRWLRFRRPRARVTFCFPTKGRRDADNHIARLKPIWDALVAAQIIPDDDVQTLGWPEYRHVYGKPGYLVIEIVEDTDVT